MTHRIKSPAPPFANQLTGQSRILVFYGGHHCWDVARANLDTGRDAVALPPGERPEDRSWPFVRGKSVVIVEMDDTGPGFRLALVRLLAAWGACEVVLITHDYNPLTAVFWGC